MENNKKLYRRIAVISDSDSDVTSPNTSSDESSGSSYHSVAEDSSTSQKHSSNVINSLVQDHTLSADLDNSEISLNSSSLEKIELSSNFIGQTVQCSPDISFDDNGSDTKCETGFVHERENHINFVPSTPSKEGTIHFSKGSASSSNSKCSGTRSLSESINTPKSPDLSETSGLFPDCDISPIKSAQHKDLSNLKTHNEDDLNKLTSTQIEVNESYEEDCHTRNNSVIICDDTQVALKEEHNSDFNSSPIKDSAFNLQDLAASISKVKVNHKETVSNKTKDVSLDTANTLPKIEHPDVLKSKIAILEKEIFNAKSTLKTANIALLPDRGVRLQMLVNNKEIDLKKLKEELYKSEQCNTHTNIPKITYKQNLRAEFEAKVHSTAPQVGGNGSSHHRAVTLDALEQLHNSIKSRPPENVFSNEPQGLKTCVKLMPHQRHALTWLLWREKQVPSGGILADDMGLGKTLTMISLILKSKEECDSKVESDDDQKNGPSESNPNLWLCSRKSKSVVGGTLVICPASLLNQWEGEVAARCKNGVLKVAVHHGQKRNATGDSLSRFDIVITTYSIVRSECPKKGALFQVNWRRIILDEAHVVRNYKNQTSVAVCELKGKNRWALTGTPIHNKEVDLFALIKFLRCAPFDEYAAWRRWVDNKNASGLQRLNTIVNSLMLRRTKEQLQTLGTLQCLPDKQFHQINLKLQKDEFAVYKTVLHFSRTLVAQYLHQQMEKEQQLLGIPYVSGTRKIKDPQNNPFLGNSDLAVLNKQINAVQDVKTFQILVLILRLRQICCHPGLIKSMIGKESHEADGIEDSNDLEDELESKLKDLSLLDDNIEDAGVKEKVLVKDNPVFNIHRSSSKMKILFSTLTETIFNTNDKAVIISQWTEMLNIIHKHLNDMGVKCAILSGSVPVKDRMEIVHDFNDSSSTTQILLLSLTAGGVGLNLVGANHLFLFDLHWNPQLEAQAFDRVYRVGQKKPVHLYKFLCEETIEQRIQRLQEHKLSLASNVLTGVKQQNSQKLSLNDIKMLFSM